MNRFSAPRFPRRNFLAGAGAAAVGVSLGTFAKKGWAEEAKKLNVYNWDTYIGQTTLQTFTDKTGIAVQYDLYANNEELFAKLKAGNPGYDVIFPSDYMIETMTKLNMLMALDHSKIPNLANINPAKQFSDPVFNPGLKFGVPYMWGTQGLGYNAAAIEKRMPNAPTDSWDLLFKPEIVAKFADCGVAMLDSPSEIFPIALNYLGLDRYSAKPEDYAKVEAMLTAIRPSIRSRSATGATSIRPACAPVMTRGSVAPRACASTTGARTESTCGLPASSTLTARGWRRGTAGSSPTSSCRRCAISRSPSMATAARRAPSATSMTSSRHWCCS